MRNRNGFRSSGFAPDGFAPKRFGTGGFGITAAVGTIGAVATLLLASASGVLAGQAAGQTPGRSGASAPVVAGVRAYEPGAGGASGVVSGGIAPGTVSAETAAAHNRMLRTYCMVCHNDRMRTGNMTLSGFDAGSAAASAPSIDAVLMYVTRREGGEDGEGR